MLKFIFLTCLIFLTTCSSPEKKAVNKSLPTKEQAIGVYQEGLKALEKADYFYASKKFSEAEMLLPQSDWAAKSSLMSAYCLYSINFYDDAILGLERFIKTYPNDKNIPYAHFLLGMCYYENIIDERKDLEPLIRAKKKFEFITKEYPDTDFALDAAFKIELIKDIMAAKEMHIGRHYIKKEKWIAAINRFKTVLKDYETTIFVEEALHRLVELHFKLGLIDESKKYAALLGYNYQSSKWYEETYKILNKDYVKISKNKDKDKQESIIKKFKDLLK